MASKKVVIKKGEGDAYWFGGVLMEIKVTGRDTGGQMAVVEMTAPANLGAAAPLHTHAGDETLYVLEGTIRVHVGDEVTELLAGSQMHIPRDTWEYYENVSNKTARVLVTYSGAASNIDQFFREAGQRATSRDVSAIPKGAADIATITQIGKKYGIEVKAAPARPQAAAPPR
ncbi:cupin domain-containing protein [Sandaracinus amylolyticus]|uniref:cupin domain-containing protein n=1 Tax=Sandaracinus amylolyticus TaxID=927083 RepID=UPI0012EE35B2|nr:cupin domain-containing protein [Sandaracinus amylolyticus]